MDAIIGAFIYAFTVIVFVRILALSGRLAEERHEVEVRGDDR